MVLALTTLLSTPLAYAADATPLELTAGGEPGARSLVVSHRDLPIALGLGASGAALLAWDRLAPDRPFVASEVATATQGRVLRRDESYYDPLFGSVRYRNDAVAASWTDRALLWVPLATLALPTTDLASRGGLARYGGKKLIVYESLAFTWSLTASLKMTLQRPRPYTYYGADPTWTGVEAGFAPADAFWSMPSGHTAVVTAAGVSWVTTELLASRQKISWRWAALAAPLAVGGLVAVGRVRGGRHHPSDALAGWALGAGAGLAIPLLHTRTGLSLQAAPGHVGVGGVLP